MCSCDRGSAVQQARNNSRRALQMKIMLKTLLNFNTDALASSVLSRGCGAGVTIPVGPGRNGS